LNSSKKKLTSRTSRQNTIKKKGADSTSLFSVGDKVEIQIIRNQRGLWKHLGKIGTITATFDSKTKKYPVSLQSDDDSDEVVFVNILQKNLVAAGDKTMRRLESGRRRNNPKKKLMRRRRKSSGEASKKYSRSKLTQKKEVISVKSKKKAVKSTKRQTSKMKKPEPFTKQQLAMRVFE